MPYKDSNYKELAQLLARITDPQLMNAFLEDLLTPKEWAEVVARWQLVKALDRGVPQREIAQNLNISIAKITRGSRELSDPTGGFRKILTLRKAKKI